MGPVRVLILAVALTSAIGAALLVRNMAQGQPETVVTPVAGPAAVQQPMSDVLVAARDLPRGTTLVEDDLAWQSWPEDSLNEQFITKTSAPRTEQGVAGAASQAAEVARAVVTGPEQGLAAMVGAIVRDPILAGEPVVERKLVRGGSAGIMSVTLQPGMRAMAVPLTAESAAGGFILPGDHVDVVQSREAVGLVGGQGFVSRTVLTNVKVLAIDQTTGSEEAAVVGATATLEVSADQAEAMVQAKAEGELTLILRSYADTEGPTRLSSLSAPESNFNSAAVVRVFRDGQPSEVAVSR